VKLRNGTQKYILKKAVRGLVPDEIIDRRKHGFGIPAHDWFGGRLGHYARDRIDEMCRHTDFFDRAAVLRFIEQVPPSKQKTRQQWLLLSFALWWHEHMQ
jgi:asparagine synthase (glutamine-hydrolysing)